MTFWGSLAVRTHKADDFFMSSTCSGWNQPEEAVNTSGSPQPSKISYDRQQAVLENIIENRIIPRLLLAHRPVIAPWVPASDATAAMLAGYVDEFAEIVVNRDASAAFAFFEARREQGASIEQLFQDLLAPAARRLGELWDEDINDFLDVTRGVTHLQQIVNEFSGAFRDESRVPTTARRALIMPLPGDQHTFGASLVGEYFRRDGWRVWGGPPRSLDDIVELADGQWFDVIGLSASSLPNPEKVAADIRIIRRASHNKGIRVIIGGRIFNDTPGLAEAVGADATASDGRQAITKAAALIGKRAAAD